MHPSFAAFALYSVITATSGSNPAWNSDYRQARTLSAKVQKPMAVFVASGKAGWNKVLHDGNLTTEQKKLLNDRYVAVYIDKDSEAGKSMAEAFGLVDQHGLIISNRGGSLQAFRHAGELTGSDLVKALNRYSDPAHVVSTTESSQPVVQPASLTPTNYLAPAFAPCQT